MFDKILVGTRSSGEDAPLLEAAARLAVDHDAELVVLRLVEAIDARRVFDPQGVPESSCPLRSLRGRFPGLRVRSHVAHGEVVSTVCALAQAERPDLIVVAQRRRHRRGSQALVDRAPCPVLVLAA